MQVPDVCANCALWVVSAADDGQILSSQCRCFPIWVSIENPLNHNCGQFKLSANPLYLPEEQETAVDEFDSGIEDA